MTTIQSTVPACRAKLQTIDRSTLQGPVTEALNDLVDALGNAASTTATFSREALDRLAQAGDVAVEAATSAYQDVAETVDSAAELGGEVLDGVQSLLDGGASYAMLGASTLGSALDLVL